MQYITGILDFIEQGGVVIWAIFITCILLWATIIERLWYLRISFPKSTETIIGDWQNRHDRHSWRARKIRQATLSEHHMRLHNRLSIVQTLIVICPLLGLLGSVTGMIGVFELIGASGNSDARDMASGIYRATIPTMAGLVVALSGYYIAARLKQLASNNHRLLADRMILS